LRKKIKNLKERKTKDYSPNESGYLLIRMYVKSKGLNTSQSAFDEIFKNYTLSEIIDGNSLSVNFLELLDKSIMIAQASTHKNTLKGIDISAATRNMEKIEKERLERERIERERPKKRTELIDKLPNIENLIGQMQFSKAAIKLRDIRKIAREYNLFDILGLVEKNLNICETHIIKKTVLDLGTKFGRLQVIEIYQRSSGKKRR